MRLTGWDTKRSPQVNLRVNRVQLKSQVLEDVECAPNRPPRKGGTLNEGGEIMGTRYHGRGASEEAMRC